VKRIVFIASALASLLCANFAYAWHVSGSVLCDATGLPLGGVTVQAISNDGGGFTGSATTDASGAYFIALPDDVLGCYNIAPLVGANESVVTPPSGSVSFCPVVGASETVQNFVISSPACANEGCWLTGGGAKFSSITNSSLGVSQRSSTSKATKDFNWGGNVNPGCSPTAGQGGQWNTIDNGQSLHFQGTAIQVVRCGNVDGIPPGSTSPVTPFNFIEFTGTGRVKGIKGNKADYPLVYFFGRAEDRNEPGSNGQHDGAGKDRYFLNVYTDPSNPTGSSIMLVDMDGDPATVDPLIITDGNMQIHVSSCDTPPSFSTASAPGNGTALMATSATNLPTEISFSTPRPNPAVNRTFLNYSLPSDAKVSLAIFDVTGRMVRQLENGLSSAGNHSVTWNLDGSDGGPVARGMYFARLMVDSKVYTQHVIVSQ
jgi:hypothetical protein